MLNTLLAMIESARSPTPKPRPTCSPPSTTSQRRPATGELRADVTAEDIAANLIGIFTGGHPPEARRQSTPPTDILLDGLRPHRAHHLAQRIYRSIAALRARPVTDRLWGGVGVGPARKAARGSSN